MQKVPITVSNEDGSPAQGATVQVRDAYSGLNLTLYEDNETTTKTNPITVGTSGIAEFKIQNSVIDVIVTNGAATRTIPALKVSDGAELQLLTNGSGGALTFGDVCYIDTDGTAKKATNAGTEQQARARWICLTRGGLANAAVGVFSGPGKVAELSGGVAGSSAWLDTAGAIVETPLDPTDPANVGKFRVYLGEWLSTTALNFQPTEPVEI
jgi:hypothetical protein